MKEKDWKVGPAVPRGHEADAPELAGDPVGGGVRAPACRRAALKGVPRQAGHVRADAVGGCGGAGIGPACVSPEDREEHRGSEEG